MTILACDPGLSGAFAIFLPDGHLEVIDMPVTVWETNRRDKAHIGEYGLLALLQTRRAQGATVLVVENVAGAPRQSAPAAFTFGYGVGLVVMAAIAEGYAIERVLPAVWKRALRVPADKRASRARASELLPEHAWLWPLAKHHGRAEAAMLALYAERFLT